MEEHNQQPERWERTYSKLFRVLFACGVAFFAYLYFKDWVIGLEQDWVIGLEQARERGTLGAELLRTGVRSLPLVAVFGLSFYLRRYRLPIERILSKGRPVLFVYDFTISSLAFAATGFLDRSFWSWGFLLVMPLVYSAAHATLVEAPRNPAVPNNVETQH